jgi:AraC-like DNA-binding protein
MKTIAEKVIIPKGKSFRIFMPNLRNHFYWHYHPEIELVYVEALTGIRHVGQHVSSYVGSDLIFIGSNIPHLNFDYGLKTEYRQIVVQLKEDFLGTALEDTPELESIKKLFHRATMGLSFSGRTKEKVAILLRRMLGEDNFKQLLTLIEIFQTLAQAKNTLALNEKDTSIKQYHKDKIRMSVVYDYIDKNFDSKPDVKTIAFRVHLSTASFCRYFKKQTRMTFTDFVNQYRINHAKTLLLQDSNVTQACYAVGFESLSYFNKLFRRLVGVNPKDFKKTFAA